MMRHVMGILVLVSGAVAPAAAQRLTPSRHAASESSARVGAVASLRRDLPHYGKWLTAAGAAAFTVLASAEHRRSRRDWDALLEICRSAQDACVQGPDGRYLRGDAELLYQRSRVFDRRANRWLLGAQGSLLLTTALFIIDMRPGEGPDNIPFPSNHLDVGSTPDRVTVGLRFAF
jgi:hypothetical protein